MISENGHGFFRIKDLVDYIDEYEKNRNKYPNMESYMPAIIIFILKQPATSI
jgi:hypothetical protein